MTKTKQCDCGTACDCVQHARREEASTHDGACAALRGLEGATGALSDREAHSRAIAAGIGVATLVASWFYAPFSQTGPVFCPFRLLTGLPCPSCGLTRSFCACAHGQWQSAFAFHALGPILFFIVIVGLPLLTIEAITRRRIKFWNAVYSSNRIAIAFAFIFGGAHLVRLVYFASTGLLWHDVHTSLLGQLLFHAVR